MTNHDNDQNALLGELHALVDQPLTDHERRRVVDELFIAEATDVAAGWRHVTIVHGWLAPNDELETLDPILNQAATFLGSRNVRMVAGPFHCTLTIAGDDVEATVDATITGLASVIPSSWRLVRSARPT